MISAKNNLPVKAGKVIGLSDEIYFTANSEEHMKALDVKIRNATYNERTNTFTGMALPASPDMVGTLYKVSISENSIWCTCPAYNFRVRPINNISKQRRSCKHILALSTKILTSFQWTKNA